ncbi:MAG: glycosyltransferase family 4 protein [Actinobacteria bacterium]|nr:glycosyltransferase family 4 protein [Actinomycetota bacterium]
MGTRIVGTARGNPDDPHSTSGVSFHLFEALARRYELVGRVDVALTPAQRALALAAAFHPRRERWRQRFWRSGVAFELMSRNSRAALARLQPQPDVAVQVHALFQTRGVPYTIEIDTTHRLNREGWPAWSPFSERAVQRWYAHERRAYHGAAHLFARTEPVAASLVEHYGVPAERVTVTGGGAHFDPLPEARPRTREPVVLFVGREWVRKGGEDLLAAFARVRAQLPAARLRIAGPSPGAEQPGVEWLGAVGDRARLAQLYREAAVFCLPSRFEPYGNVLSEAMAFGLPCVATRTLGIPAVVLDGQTGLLVPIARPEPLADALLRLLSDPELADRLGAAGRERVRTELTWDHVAARMAPVLDRFASRD